MDLIDLFKVFWAPAMVAVGFFSALYWQLRQVLLAIRTQVQKDKEQDTRLSALELSVVKLQAEHNGAFALLHQKLDNLRDLIDVIGKRLNTK